MYEIYLCSDNKELMVELREQHTSTPLKNMPYDFITTADQKIERQYPKAHKLLCEKNGEHKASAFGRVKTFFACNFSIKDDNTDIDQDWNFKLENVPCPARITGICEGGICKPEITSVFSKREIEVLRYFADGLDEREIAEHLFISKCTVHNHINNMYEKAGLHGKTSPDRKLVAYAHAKQII